MLEGWEADTLANDYTGVRCIGILFRCTDKLFFLLCLIYMQLSFVHTYSLFVCSESYCNQASASAYSVLIGQCYVTCLSLRCHIPVMSPFQWINASITYVYHMFCHLDRHVFFSTHWYWDKMAAIFQPSFSNAFSWMKMYEFRLRFYWSLFLRVQLTIFQHWFR